MYAAVACDLMSISPELSNSTPEGPFRAQHERLRIQPETLRRLMDMCDYQLKFVIAQEEDIGEMRQLAGRPERARRKGDSHAGGHRCRNPEHARRVAGRSLQASATGSARDCTCCSGATSEVSRPMTILCLASYEKGQRFLTECKRQGATVVLITSLSLKEKAHWPVEVSTKSTTCRTATISGTARICSKRGHLSRPHARVRPHRGAGRFRRGDRGYAARAPSGDGVRRNDGALLPRQAGDAREGEGRRDPRSRFPPCAELRPAARIHGPRARPVGAETALHGGLDRNQEDPQQDEFWSVAAHWAICSRSICWSASCPAISIHVDSVIFDGDVRFAIASGYGRPPMEVSHDGGVFTSRILDRESALAQDLIAANARVMRTFGMRRGVSHTEFICAAADGQIYFLETSARVGGAHVSDLIEAATGLNLWEEWARLEVAENEYPSPQPRGDYAGLLVTLARQPHPDTSAYNDPEVVWRMDREHHAGLIVKSPSVQRVEQLLAAYSARMLQDFGAYMAPRERPTS